MAYRRLIGSKCMMFHMWITVNHGPKQFSITNTPWHWPLDPKINRAYHRLMGYKCIKFYDHRWNIFIIVQKLFSITNVQWPWTSKSIRHILDSLGARIWSFMIIGELHSQLWPRNHFKSSTPHDLDLLIPNHIGHIFDSWEASVWSFMIIGGLYRELWSRNHIKQSIPHDLDLWTQNPICQILESWGASAWSFMIIV